MSSPTEGGGAGRAAGATSARAAADRPAAGRLAGGIVLAGLLLASAPTAAPAAPLQAAAPGDTLDLAELHRIVPELDPRAEQFPLHEAAARARLRRLDGRWLPRLRLQGEATYQTDVPTALSDGSDGGTLPGLAVPEPPRDRWDVGLEVEQLLFDGGRVGRGRSVERSRLAERRWDTRASLHELRQELDRAFFTALLGQERRRQLELLRDDLEARRQMLAARVRAGSLLRSELAAVEAELVEAGQELDAAEADRRAALDRVSLLLDREIPPGTVLSVPELAPTTAAVREELATGHDQDRVPWGERPAWNRLGRTAERLRAQAAAEEAETRPRATAFVRGAVGRPGLDFFDDAVSPYATAGVRVRWDLFDGGSAGAEARALRLDARIAETERAALGESLRRRAVAVGLEIDRLERALDSDDRLVALRERRRRTALRQLEEGVLLPDEYVERSTDVFEARLRRRTHRVQLAEARARLLRILGRSLPEAGGTGLRVRLDAASPPPRHPDGAQR